jgi:non-heme chloroperoxidase
VVVVDAHCFPVDALRSRRRAFIAVRSAQAAWRYADSTRRGPYAPRIVTSSVALATGLSLSYTERGDPDGPAVVFLPGPTDSWRSYRTVLDQLPPTLRAISVSQRGHGDSDKPATGYRIQDFAADAVALLDALRIERAVLAGHSASCLMVRQVAIDRPNRVAGLVLEASPTTLRGEARLERFIESAVLHLDDPIDPDFARAFVVGTSSDALDATLVDELVAEVLKVPARVWHHVFAALLGYDGTADLHRIIPPTLMIWGDADPLVTRAMQDDLASRIGAELVVFSGVGHTPRWEETLRFADQVAAFARRAFDRDPSL